MIEHFYLQPHHAERLRRGLLEPHLDGFAQLLFQQGYSRQAARQKLRLAADLSRWLERKRLPVAGINEQRVDEFLTARWRRRRWHNSDQSSLSLLLRQLRQIKVIPAEVIPVRDGPLERLVKDYERFLTQERGVVQATLDNYLPIARRFLVAHFKPGKLWVNALRSHHVVEFISGDVADFCLQRVQVAASALRSFLGYLEPVPGQWDPRWN